MSNKTKAEAKHNMFHDPNPCYLGDFVEHIHEPSLKGRISNVHYSCPENNTWLRSQTLLGPDPMQYKDDRWVSILVHEGGSIAVPDRFVRVVDPFPIRNDSIGMYFPLDEWVIRRVEKPEGVAISLAGVRPGAEIAVWAFEVVEERTVGLANWHSGVVLDIFQFEDRWYEILFEGGKIVRAVTIAQAVSP